jgi:tetratricopeptide (TPR) repeat protein
LYILLRRPPQFEKTRSDHQYWNPERQSPIVVVASVLGLAACLIVLSSFAGPAYRMGLPFVRPRFTVLLLIGLLWIHTAFHESGHALAAWAVGFRLRSLCVGPMMFRRGNAGWGLRFEWKGLIKGGGYVGSAPRSHEGVRVKEILVVAAGPIASAIAGFGFLLAFYLLPGTRLAPLAYTVALASALGFYEFVLNLIPAGYTDGQMLLHLILRTHRGDQLIAGMLASQEQGAADERCAAGDFENAVALRREALRRLKDSGEPDTIQLAGSHAMLGLAELPNEAYVNDAESNFRQGLIVLARTPGNASVEAACWVGLHRLAMIRQRPEEADHDYRSAMRAIEKMWQAALADDFTVYGHMAELHATAAAFEPALDAIERAMDAQPRRSDRLTKGVLLRLRAQCELQLGHTVAGLGAAEEAAAIFRSDDSSGSGSRAPLELGLLGLSLWQAGHDEQAVSLLKESILLLRLRGAANAALRFRLQLAGVLREAGRVREAGCVLPEPGEVGIDFRKTFLKQRGQIRRRSGHMQEALADFRELMRLTAADAQASDVDIALAKSSLAEAHLDAGNIEIAASLAYEAREMLAGIHHPETAAVSVTLALISWRKEERSAPAWLREAMRIYAQAPLLLPAVKARFFESTARKLEEARRTAEAVEWRTAADTCWRTLGRTAEVVAATEEIRQQIPA